MGALGGFSSGQMAARMIAAVNLAGLRLDGGLTQAGLAAKAQLSRLALGRIERDAVVPSAGTMRALAKALDVPVRELVAPVRPLRSVRFRAEALQFAHRAGVSPCSHGW